MTEAVQVVEHAETRPSFVNEPPKDAGTAPELSPKQMEESRRLAAYWKDQLDQVKDQWRRFEKRGRTIEKRYRDERNRVDEEGQRRYNYLWSYIQTMLPAVYGRMPLPIAERRFRDRDPAGRAAASILERALRNEVEICGLGEALELACLDWFLPGRGTVWVRYEPEFEQVSVSIPTEGEMEMRDAQGEIATPDDSETEDKLRDTSERVIRESVPVDYVPWSDFFTFPAKARVWKEVVAVGKRVYMTKEQMVRRFGPVGKKVPLEKDDRERRRQNESVAPDQESDRKGEVYEIWDRGTERAYWLAEGYDMLLDRQDDPLKLDSFFPVPKPLFANPTTNTLVPVADFIQFQDQANQLDELTQRISQLAKACKVAGVYNAAAKDIARLLDESVENELIPVDQWAAFGDKGGVAGQISLLPLKEILGVLNELMEVREKVLVDADRITGFSDVMRGSTDARETLGAQRLKTNGAGTRLSKRQAEMARFARDVVRLIAEVMCNHFSSKSLMDASGALYEEGLGAVDPELLDKPPAQGLQAPAGAPPAPQPPPIHPAIAGPPGGQPGQPVPAQSIPNAAPPNVVPMRPGLPMSAPQMALPGMGPPPMGAMQSQPPQLPPQVQKALEAFQRIAQGIRLLRDDRLRGFRVDIEVDSTVFGDAAQEKQDRTEFLSATTQFLQVASQLGAANPRMVPLLGKMLGFGVRGFRAGRDLEMAIEDFVDEADQQAKEAIARPPQPSPEQIKADTAIKTTQMKGQLDQQKIQAQAQQTAAKMRTDQVKSQSDAQQTAMKIHADQVKGQAEVQRQQAENQGEMFNSQADTQQKQMELEMRRLELEIEKLRLQSDLAKAQAQVEASKASALRPPPQTGAGGL